MVSFAPGLLISLLIDSSGNNTDNSKAATGRETVASQTGPPEYFNLRPKLEKEYGYSETKHW